MSEATGEGNLDHLVKSQDPEHPSNLIPELCRKFYSLGWVTGTGGGVSGQQTVGSECLTKELIDMRLFSTFSV